MVCAISRSLVFSWNSESRTLPSTNWRSIASSLASERSGARLGLGKTVMPAAVIAALIELGHGREAVGDAERRRHLHILFGSKLTDALGENATR